MAMAMPDKPWTSSFMDKQTEVRRARRHNTRPPALRPGLGSGWAWARARPPTSTPPPPNARLLAARSRQDKPWRERSACARTATKP